MTSLVPEPLTEDLFDAAWASIEDSFGAAPHPADRAVERDTVVPERFLVVRDGAEVVATSGAFPLRMTVPGGAAAPVAGVTWVGVRSTHRRRGLLTTMMAALLREAHERGEAFAALWASEAAIYQRFGYGPASWALQVTVPRGAGVNRQVPAGGLRRVAPDAAVLAPVHDAVAAVTPGMPARDDAWWRARLHDAEHSRSGASPLQCLVTDDGTGYALYATAMSWSEGRPDGEVRVRELLAATPDAHARLWRHLLDLDLTARTTARVAADDRLLQLLAEPRGAVARVVDGLWVRPVDVGAVLGARAYAAEVDVVLEVDDAACPWNAGRWRLSGGPAGAVCARTTDAADLAVGAADLGAALLGGTPLRTRAVDERRPGALAAASTALGAVGAGPYCPMVF